LRSHTCVAVNITDASGMIRARCFKIERLQILWCAVSI
jgi:hypothetical protein